MPNSLTKNKVKNYDNYYNSYNPCPFIIHNNSPIKSTNHYIHYSLESFNIFIFA